MARPVLRAFVNGTRQLLTAQLVVSVVAVALAGWTLAVTSDLIRDRDRLRDRVIQLEQAMASGGMVVPATPVVVDQPAVASDATAYPGEVGYRAGTALHAPNVIEVSADPGSLSQRQAAPTRDASANFSRVLTGLFAPPPPLDVVVLHLRAPTDTDAARSVAADLIRAAHVRVILHVMQPRDPRQSGYAYFDGRQSAAAAALVAQFNDLARQHDVAPWSAQLRGTALPTQGEYSADRVDLVLPPLPPPAPPPLETQAPPAAGAPAAPTPN